MAYVALISRTDLQAVGDIPVGLLDARLNPVIRQTQEVDLQPLLGDALYTDLMANISDPDYVKLLDGDTYTNDDGDTVDFPGLRIAISLWTMARLIIGNNKTVTGYGYRQKEDPYSKDVDAGEKAVEVNRMKKDALTYWGKVEKYLNKNSDVFDLWKCTNVRKSGTVRINSISKYQ